ncbi:hypothetical protein E2562_019628 [Oryza meyeriana var. granulata]|uniref:Uncharacterized protein n=1 Tax=Oryza meyeriana var. granulata TaxID=110450 RepID=A0A6G1C7K5_9ORYZ|nr:hypothetical protein E2562_019628 [Oryza meyeriana var. granulata]
MLRVVLGSGDVSASKLPMEDLALCDDPGRVARQAILPKCDAKGILERTSEGAPRPMRIPGVDGGEAHQDGSTARTQEPVLQGVLPTLGTRGGQASALGAKVIRSSLSCGLHHCPGSRAATHGA